MLKLALSMVSIYRFPHIYSGMNSPMNARVKFFVRAEFIKTHLPLFPKKRVLALHMYVFFVCTVRGVHLCAR